MDGTSGPVPQSLFPAACFSPNSNDFFIFHFYLQVSKNRSLPTANTELANLMLRTKNGFCTPRKRWFASESVWWTSTHTYQIELAITSRPTTYLFRPLPLLLPITICSLVILNGKPDVTTKLEPDVAWLLVCLNNPTSYTGWLICSLISNRAWKVNG